MKKILISVVLVMAMLAISIPMAVPAFAAGYTVSDGQSIQAAIDAASPGATITVGLGTYNEQLVIDKPLTIEGSGSETIIAPPSTGNVTTSAIVSINNANVTIEDLTINGEGEDNYYGIYYSNAGGMVDNVTIVGIHHTPLTGSQHGVALYAKDTTGDSYNLIVSNNTIQDFQKGGIVANGTGLNAIVKNNSVTVNAESAPAPTSTIAQNDIQIGYGATGQILNNIVSSVWYTGDNWTASGILVFETNGVSVVNNTVSDCQSGIVAETQGYKCPTASNNIISNNLVTDAEYGITADAWALSWSTMNSSADNNKIVDNTISDTADYTGDTGIYVGAYTDSDSTSYNAEANNNKIIHNTVIGFTKSIGTNDSSITHANQTPIN